MRAIQTVNDTIRLLFNPKTEVFSLSDFLLVRDTNEHFLGQVVEVYDDKFDLESNVAKIKLIFRVVNGNELLPYNGYTPSKECEVARIKQSEIEKCINLNKETVKIGKSFKSNEETEINLDFFENNLVIYADKYEQTNRAFENLAGKLSAFKPVVVLDFSGACDIEKTTRFTAGENFKIPLSSFTIDYLRQKVLLRAKMETQLVLGDVFDAVRDYLQTADEDYISYSRFIKVVQAQSRQTSSLELNLLISWLKKYARMNVFAKNKKEYENFFKSIKKNKVTTVDFSGVKVEWQKEYVEYLLNAINDDIFLFVRLNDNNINYDMLSLVYLKKKNISFIPSFAYGYSKASYIMDYAKNYVLMPTINPRRDFTTANFQIQSLNNDCYMLFGDDTKDFIFIVENTSKIQKRRENTHSEGKLLISLNLELEDMTPLELREDNFEAKKPKEPVKKRLQEEIKLSDILKDDEKDEEKPEETSGNSLNAVNYSENINQEEQNSPKSDVIEQTNSNDDFVIVSSENINENKVNQETSDIIDIIEDEIINSTNKNKETEESEKSDNAPLNTENNNDFPKENDFSVIKNKEEINQENTTEKALEADDISQFEALQEKELHIKKLHSKEKNQDEQNVLNNQPQEQLQEKVQTPQEFVLEEETINNDTQNEEENVEIAQEENKEESLPILDMPKIKEAEIVNEEVEEETTPLQEFARLEENSNSEDEIIEAEAEILDESFLDAIDEANMAKQEKNEPVQSEIEPDENEEIDRRFEQIMDEEERAETKKDVLKINDKVSIDLSDIKKDTKQNDVKLPVFDDENDNDTNALPPSKFKENDVVSCDKYGVGTVLKVIKYGDRCLLQIEFPEIGKRLLDTKIAKIKLAENV